MVTAHISIAHIKEVTLHPAWLLQRWVTVSRQAYNVLVCNNHANSVPTVSHTQPLTALLEFVRDHPGEQVPER